METILKLIIQRPKLCLRAQTAEIIINIKFHNVCLRGLNIRGDKAIIIEKERG